MGSLISFGTFPTQPGAIAESVVIRSRVEPIVPRDRFSILVIDDDQCDTRLLRLALKWTKLPHQASVHVVEDCEAALNALVEGIAPVPALIILNLQRKGKRCLNALKRLKQNERTRPIPVVAWAAQDAADLDDAYAAHANCVLTKPETVEQMAALLSRIQRFWFSPGVVLPPAAAARV